MQIPQNRQEFGTTEHPTEGLVVSERRVADNEAGSIHETTAQPWTLWEGVWILSSEQQESPTGFKQNAP